MQKTGIDLNNRTILVTGSPGFIGACLALRLLREMTGGTVISLDSMNGYYDPALKEYRLGLIEAGRGRLARGARLHFSVDDRVDTPVSLYAATKKSNELLAHSYSKLYNIPATGLRLFTVYGPAGEGPRRRRAAHSALRDLQHRQRRPGKPARLCRYPAGGAGALGRSPRGLRLRRASRTHRHAAGGYFRDVRGQRGPRAGLRLQAGDRDPGGPSALRAVVQGILWDLTRSLCAEPMHREQFVLSCSQIFFVQLAQQRGDPQQQ